MTHKLKMLPVYFFPAWEGLKPFEIRKYDRGFKVGDNVILQEWDEEKGYSGREIYGVILYVTQYMQRTGYCVFSYSLTRRG